MAAVHEIRPMVWRVEFNNNRHGFIIAKTAPEAEEIVGRYLFGHETVERVVGPWERNKRHVLMNA